MNSKRIVFLLLAVIVAGTTAFLARAWLQAERAANVLLDLGRHGGVASDRPRDLPGAHRTRRVLEPLPLPLQLLVPVIVVHHHHRCAIARAEAFHLLEGEHAARIGLADLDAKLVLQLLDHLFHGFEYVIHTNSFRCHNYWLLTTSYIYKCSLTIVLVG
jgi:hypothetical protein